MPKANAFLVQRAFNMSSEWRRRDTVDHGLQMQKVKPGELGMLGKKVDWGILEVSVKLKLLWKVD